MNVIRILCLLALLVSANQARAITADLIFLGNIITIDADQPKAEAVAVTGDKIVAVGKRQFVLDLASESTRIVDLGENALLPGFIDAHGHMTMYGSVTQMINLSSPPVGPVNNISDVVSILKAKIEEDAIPPGGWIFGYGYDDSLIAERRHPNRDDLDEASSEHPIALTHVSGHLMTSNTMALEAANITSSSQDPAGGVIRRRPGTNEPNGVLEESATYPLRAPMIKMSTPERTIKAMHDSASAYASFGITTVQDGGSSPMMVELYRQAAKLSPFPVDVVAYIFGNSATESELDTIIAEDYLNGFRVGGVKLLLDGSPQGRTAYLSRPYNQGPPSTGKNYRAYPVIEQEEYDKRIARLISNGTPVLTHANGDAAIDMMIDGVDKAIAGGEIPDHRTVIIHAQLIREDQLHRIKSLGLVPSYYAAHPFFWGDWHRKSFGEVRASFISPVARTAELAIPFTIHNDTPIVPPDMMRLLWITTNRETRSGYILGPDQRATIMQGLHAVTLGAAYQYFEEETKGSISVGKQADLVVLGADPLTVKKTSLKDIPIIETFSRGRSVYKR